MEPDLSTAKWKRASKCDNSGGNCVEVAQVAGQWAVRDSKDPSGGALLFAPDEWRTFLDGVRTGEFD